MKRKFVLFFMLILISLSLFAGGKKEEKEVKTVLIWHPNTGKAGTTFNSLVDNFNSTIGEEKGIKIEAIYQGKANDVITKIKATPEEMLPDIAQLDATACLDLNSSTFLKTIDELYIDTNDIINQAKNAFRSERGLIALPFNASSLVLYYNKTLFDSLNLEVSKTLNDFAKFAPLLVEKDKNGNITRYAFSGVPTTLELTTFIGSQNGLSYIVDEKNGHYGIPREVLMDKEGTYVEFLKAWKNFYDSGAVNNLTSGVSSDFSSGRTASFLASSSNLATILSTTSSFEVGVAPVPLVNERATGGVATSGGALFAFSDKEEVKEVLNYFISQQVQIEWAEKTGYIPVTKSALNSQAWNDFTNSNPLYLVPTEQILSSNPELTNVWLPSSYQIYYSIQENIDNVCKGKMNIDEANASLCAIIQNALNTYAEQNLI